MQTGPDITELLEAWTGGDRAALDELMPTVIDELKRIASSFLVGEAHARTLQATALVNEAYLRLVRVRPHAWVNRSQFFSLTARIMRHILVDHARTRLAERRASGATPLALDAAQMAKVSAPRSLVGLDDALIGLEKLDARKSHIVELRIFTGLNNEEIAETLGISSRTVIRDWLFAKAWLAREMNYEVSDSE